MRLFFSVMLFVASLMVMTVACTLAWDVFINNHFYNCTDGGSLDFLMPGDWVHSPVAVEHVVSGRSMSEPDMIQKSWSVSTLWLVWAVFVTASVAVSVLVARLPLAKR